MTFHTITGQIEPVPPFDFEKSLDFLGLFPPTKNEQTLAARSLTKAMIVNGHPLVFQVKPAGSVENPRLEYRLFSQQPLEPETHEAAINRVTFFLSLNDDLTPFYKLGQSDGAFAPIIERFYGYHQVKFLTPFENACWAVLTQRNRIPLARKMKQALVEKFGAGLQLNGVQYWAFPEPVQLAGISPKVLASVIQHEQKAEYLAAVAEAFSHQSEEFMQTASFDEVNNWLQAIKGIGAWSAAFVLIRGLGRVERVSFIEKPLLKAIAQFYGPAHAISKTAQRLADRYGPWQGYWAHYLRVAS